jgi:hypothetical protein
MGGIWEKAGYQNGDMGKLGELSHFQRLFKTSSNKNVRMTDINPTFVVEHTPHGWVPATET